jgi:hypothetical protein
MRFPASGILAAPIGDSYRTLRTPRVQGYGQNNASEEFGN